MRFTPFELFWKALNQAMKDRGQPEVGFADARVYWQVAQGK